MDNRVDLFYKTPFFAEWNRRFSVEVCCLEKYDSQVIIFQAVRPIHELMEEKLQIYFCRDTECLNHNTWMISCELTFLFSAWYVQHESWAAISHKTAVLIYIGISFLGTRSWRAAGKMSRMRDQLSLI